MSKLKKPSYKNLIILVFLFFSAFASSAHSFTSSSYSSPYGMIVDPDTGSYYVSNINGDAQERDGNGFISKISSNGNTVIQKFIGGTLKEAYLDTPKGIWIAGPLLYVADIDSVKVFKKKTGKFDRRIDLSALGAKELSDVVMDSAGRLYVSDMAANKIFQIDTKKNDQVTIKYEGSWLKGPNGMVVNPKTSNMIVVTWNSGEVIEIDSRGKPHTLKRGLSKLSGADYDIEGNLYVSSFEKGEIYRIPFYGRGTLSIYLGGLLAPANITCDRKKHELLVPAFKGGTVSTHPLYLQRKKDAISLLAANEKKPDNKKDRK